MSSVLVMQVKSFQKPYHKPVKHNAFFALHPSNSDKCVFTGKVENVTKDSFQIRLLVLSEGRYQYVSCGDYEKIVDSCNFLMVQRGER